jgi:hypothetical protein
VARPGRIARGNIETWNGGKPHRSEYQARLAPRLRPREGRHSFALWRLFSCGLRGCRVLTGGDKIVRRDFTIGCRSNPGHHIKCWTLCSALYAKEALTSCPDNLSQLCQRNAVSLTICSKRMKMGFHVHGVTLNVTHRQGLLLRGRQSLVYRHLAIVTPCVTNLIILSGNGGKAETCRSESWLTDW